MTEEIVDQYAEGSSNDVGATISALASPVTWLIGGAAHAGGPGAEELVRLRASVRQAEFVLVEGAGHYVQEERPEAVVRAISEMAVRTRR